MMSNRVKRALSFAVFGLGFLIGLYGCFLSARGIFTIGANDCAQEILAITLAFITPPIVFVLALWKRLFAGVWLIFAGCYFPEGMLAERSYMIHVRGFTDQVSVGSVLQNSLKVTLLLLIFGGFAVITELLQWPRLLDGHRKGENELSP